MSTRDLYFNIIGKDKMSSTMNQINGASLKTKETLGRVNTQSDSLRTSIKGAASEFPVLAQGMRFLASPAAIAAGGVGLLAVGLNRAKDAAVAFRGEFRNLQNLNLDKTNSQIEDLKQNVLQTAYSGGFNAERTSQAYYDVQSVTGKYGGQVGDIVSQVGTFAQVNKADFNQTIAGSAQAMEIYGFSVNQVDDYLKSMYKTVLVGKTTFDELSREQVEYANAAASVGQSFDNANRIFAAFSKTQKNVRLASTMTKTAFEDMTKKSTLDGLQKIGVSVFDAGGSMRGVDEILEDMIPKLKNMSDFQFAKFKEEIGGSEGIRGLLDMAKNSADKLLQGFKDFDNAKYDSLEAFKRALGDPTQLDNILTERLNTSFIRLGEKVLPLWNNMLIIATGLVDKTANVAEGIGDMWNMIFNRNQYIADQAMSEVNIKNSRADYSKRKYEDAVGGIDVNTPQKEVAALKDEIQTDLTKAWDNAFNKGNETLRSAYTRQALELTEIAKQIEVNSKREAPAGESGSGAPGAGTADSKITQGIGEVSGGGAKQTNITISIGKLNEAININTTNLSEAAPEIEERMTEILMRSLNGSAQLSQN